MPVCQDGGIRKTGELGVMLVENCFYAISPQIRVVFFLASRTIGTFGLCRPGNNPNKQNKPLYIGVGKICARLILKRPHCLIAVVIEKTHNLIAGISAVTTMRIIVVVTSKLQKQREAGRVFTSPSVVPTGIPPR